MPTWEEYKTIARERGALALELYIVESTPAGSPDDIMANLPDHLAYQKKMEAEGKLAFAGPVSDSSGEMMTGGGMIIYRAGSLDEAKTFAENDPMHKAGARTFNVRCWLINEGSFNIGVRLSEQHVAFS